MKKTYLFRISLVVLAMLLLIIQSCSDDNVLKEEQALEKKNQPLEVTPVVEKLMQMGFKVENIEELDDNYLVEQDMLFSKKIKDYPFMPGMQNRHLQVPYSELVNNDKIKNMTVYCEFCSNTEFSESNLWDNAVQEAIDAWNAVGGDCCIKFIKINSSGADITIVDGIVAAIPNSHYGITYPPSGGVPFHTIWINLNYDTSNFGTHHRRNIIAHELGHTIGFGHTDSDPNQDYPDIVTGTENSTDPYSIMGATLPNFINNNTVLSSADRLAAIALYGGCSSTQGPGPTASITGPTLIPCTSTTTYTLQGATASSWTKSDNLQIVSQTAISITVIGVSNPNQPYIPPSNTFVQANLIGGTSIQKNGLTTGPPKPVGTINPVIWGPSLLNSYQTGVYSTSTFNNYSSVQWTVYSSTLQNAGQHFQVTPTNPIVPNGFSVFVEVLPSAPAGLYTIQCKVSNTYCGDYYVQRTFTVQQGPPMFYD